VPAQEIHSTFRLPFETLGVQAMRYMNCCIPQSLSSFHQMKRYCILHCGAWFCFVVGGQKRICNENNLSIPRKCIVLVLWTFSAINEFLSQRHVAFSGSECRNLPPIWKVGANKSNKQSRIADNGWSSRLVVGRCSNKSLP